LFPIYNKIAMMFAQCHDTPQRMKDVGVVKEVVPWRGSRRYFYWRLRRRLLVNRAIDQLVKDMALEEGDWKKAEMAFDEWVAKTAPKDVDYDDDEKQGDGDVVRSNDELIRNDRQFVEWYMTQADQFVKFRHTLQMQAVETKLASIIGKFDGDKQSLQAMFSRLMSGHPTLEGGQSVTTDID